MVAGFWTLDLTTITGQSAFILRHHTAAVSSYDCTFDDLELVHKSLRTLEPLHTHKFPRVNAQDSKFGPIQPWDEKDFLTLTVSDRLGVCSQVIRGGARSTEGRRHSPGVLGWRAAAGLVSPPSRLRG